jgi:HSP20 family protein
MNVEQAQGGWRRVLTVERVLLGLIVLLQAGILWRLSGGTERGRLAEPVSAPVSSPAPQACVERGEPLDWRVVGVPAMPASVAARRAAWRRADMLDEMDAFVERAFRDFEVVNRLMAHDRGWESAVVSPAMDMRESAGEYIVLFELPGIAPDGIHVTLEGRILSVAATRGWGGGASGRGVESRVQLPGQVGDVAQASAIYTNGLLRVRVPKAGPAAGVHRVLRLM